MTINDLKRAREMFGDNEFTQEQWASRMNITLRTAIRNNAVIPFIKVTRVYATVREIIDLLNNCSGRDCWDLDCHFEIDEEGRIYEDVKEKYYRMAPVVFTES